MKILIARLCCKTFEFIISIIVSSRWPMTLSTNQRSAIDNCDDVGFKTCQMGMLISFCSTEVDCKGTVGYFKERFFIMNEI